MGYRVINKSFSLAAGETKEFEIILSPDTFGRADNIEVRAGPFELAPGRTAPRTLMLEGNDAKNLASVLADDPLRAVQALPGVSSNDDFDARFSLRGADYDRVGLYLDDILLHTPFHTVEGQSATGSRHGLQRRHGGELELHGAPSRSRFDDRTAGALGRPYARGQPHPAQSCARASASNAGLIAEGPLGRDHRGSWLAGARKSYLQYIIQRTATDRAHAGFRLLRRPGQLSQDLGPSTTSASSVLEGISDLDRSARAAKLGINSMMTGRLPFHPGQPGLALYAHGTLAGDQPRGLDAGEVRQHNRDQADTGRPVTTANGSGTATPPGCGAGARRWKRLVGAPPARRRVLEPVPVQPLRRAAGWIEYRGNGLAPGRLCGAILERVGRPGAACAGAALGPSDQPATAVSPQASLAFLLLAVHAGPARLGQLHAVPRTPVAVLTDRQCAAAARARHPLHGRAGAAAGRAQPGARWSSTTARTATCFSARGTIRASWTARSSIPRPRSPLRIPCAATRAGFEISLAAPHRQPPHRLGLLRLGHARMRDGAARGRPSPPISISATP